jgi:hypothetical protein
MFAKYTDTDGLLGVFGKPASIYVLKKWLHCKSDFNEMKTSIIISIQIMCKYMDMESMYIIFSHFPKIVFELSRKFQNEVYAYCSDCQDCPTLICCIFWRMYELK